MEARHALPFPRPGGSSPGARPRQCVGFAGAVREQAQGYVAHRRQDAVRTVSDVAAAIRESGSGFEGAPHLKAFFDGAAEGVEERSADIGRRTVAEIYHEVGAAVRRRPGVALVAAAFAGFALLRVLKASGPRPFPRSRTVVPVEIFPTPDV